MKDYIQFWPQITILLLTVFTFTKKYFFGGQERSMKLSPFNLIVKCIAEIVILVYGGFFAIWGVPQILYTIVCVFIFLVLIIISVFLYKFKEAGKEVNYKVPQIQWTDFIMLFLLYWGDFFDGLIQHVLR